MASLSTISLETLKPEFGSLSSASIFHYFPVGCSSSSLVTKPISIHTDLVVPDHCVEHWGLNGKANGHRVGFCFTGFPTGECYYFLCFVMFLCPLFCFLSVFVSGESKVSNMGKERVKFLSLVLPFFVFGKWVLLFLISNTFNLYHVFSSGMLLATKRQMHFLFYFITIFWSMTIDHIDLLRLYLIVIFVFL